MWSTGRTCAWPCWKPSFCSDQKRSSDVACGVPDTPVLDDVGNHRSVQIIVLLHPKEWSGLHCCHLGTYTRLKVAAILVCSRQFWRWFDRRKPIGANLFERTVMNLCQNSCISMRACAAGEHNWRRTYAVEVTLDQIFNQIVPVSKRSVKRSQRIWSFFQSTLSTLMRRHQVVLQPHHMCVANTNALIVLNTASCALNAFSSVIAFASYN